VRVLLCLGDFGLPVLAALVRSAHRPVYVVLATSAPAPAAPGVGERVRGLLRPLLWPGMPQGTPPALRAHGVPALLDRSGIPRVCGPLRDASVLADVALRHGADLLLSAGYPRIVPPSLLSTLPRGGLNVHPSLLPRYRGVSPVFWQIAAGEPQAGVTIHRMTAGADEGPILSQRRTPIGERDTAGLLFLRLARLAAPLVTETLDRLARGPVPELPQDPAEACSHPRFREENACLDWTRPAAELARLVRACHPYPGARAVLGGREVVRIWQARAVPGEAGAPSGTIVALWRSAFDVVTGAGFLRVRTARSEAGHRFPCWGRRWPALAAGEAFAPAPTAMGSDASR